MLSGYFVTLLYFLVTMSILDVHNCAVLLWFFLFGGFRLCEDFSLMSIAFFFPFISFKENHNSMPTLFLEEIQCQLFFVHCKKLSYFQCLWNISRMFAVHNHHLFYNTVTPSFFWVNFRIIKRSVILAAAFIKFE